MFPFLWWVVSACSGPAEPELVALEQAVSSWRTGVTQHADGAYDAALAAYDVALDARRGDVLLLAYKARSLAAAGRLGEAVDALDTVLRASPAFHEARFNRGCYLARQGFVKSGAADIQLAVAAGVVAPRDAVVDPDIQPHLADPAFDFLPDSPMSMSIELPPGPVFLGSEFRMRLTVDGVDAGALWVSASRSAGAVEVVKVVEDDVLHEGSRRRIVDYTFRATGDGAFEVADVVARSSAFEARAEGGSVRLAAPPGRVPASATPVDLSTVSARLGDRVAPSTWRSAERTWVAADPTWTVTLDPPEPPVAVRSLRRDGDPVVDLWSYAGSPEKVRLAFRGDVRFEGVPIPE